MKIIKLTENQTMANAITEMLMNKEIELYKTDAEYEVYKIKNVDVYVCLICDNAKCFKRYEYIMEYNSKIFRQLYGFDNLNAENLISLYNLHVFM